MKQLKLGVPKGSLEQATRVTIWKAAETLGHYLSKHSITLILNRSVLELGVGLGLCGILAHRLGASRVCLTDGDSDALPLLKENLERNGPTEGTTR